MLFFVLGILFISIAILVYALRASHSVGIIREKLADCERENKKLSWDKETLEKRLERSQQTVSQLKRQVDRLKQDLTESRPEHVKKFESGSKVTAVDILLRDNQLTEQDVEDVREFLRKNPLKMDLEGALVFKEKITSEQLSKANEKANAHNAALAKAQDQGQDRS